MLLTTFSVLRSATSSVDSASLVTYSRLPSGDAAAPWFTSIPPISPTTVFVTGSISITLSPAALVWTIRTVAAWRVRVPSARAGASSRESLVFIATHFKLPGHVAVSFFELPAPGRRLDPRLRRLQGKGPAAPRREAPGPCPLYHVPFDQHGVPAAAAPEGADGIHRGRVAKELRGGLAHGP